MARHATREGVLVLTSDTMPTPTLITENPKVSLYTYLPFGSRCAFSVHAGEPALNHSLPDRGTLRDWSPQKVEEAAAVIRRLHTDAVEGMTAPCHWEDLHQYFHPIDLWCKGASNLHKVILRLLKENEVCIWVEKWLTWEQNRYKLSLWDTIQDIRSVFDPSDWYNIHAPNTPFPEEYVVFLCGVLKYWYDYYRNLEIVAVASAGTAVLVAPAIVATSPPEDTLQLEGQGKFTHHCCPLVFFLR